MQPVEVPQIPDFAKDLQQISSYAEVQEVMKSPDFAMGSAPERRVFFDDTMMFAEGKRHLELKRQFGDLFSREAMAYYEHHLLAPVIDDTMRELMAGSGAGDVIKTDLVPLIQTMLFRISAGVTGVDGLESAERCLRFKDLVTRLGFATAGQFARGDRGQVVADGKVVLQELIDEFLQASLDRRIALAANHHAGKIAKADLPRDALMTLCLLNDLSRPDDATRVPYVWRQCSLFLIASVQTTTHTFPHVVVHIDEWMKQHPEDMDRLQDIEFLQACVGEALRLHQTAPLKFRIAQGDVTLSTGRTVAAGEMVALHAPSANLEEGLFGADARYFNPDRRNPVGIPTWGMTFGAGRHMCIGRNLVVGVSGKVDKQYGTEGEMVRILRALYDHGCALDPANPPVMSTASYHDAFDSVPIVLRAGRA